MATSNSTRPAPGKIPAQAGLVDAGSHIGNRSHALNELLLDCAGFVRGIHAHYGTTAFSTDLDRRLRKALGLPVAVDADAAEVRS